MDLRDEFNTLIEKLKTERDELKLKIKLGAMEAREEFEQADKLWDQLKGKASDIADDAVETTDEYIGKARSVGEELKETYHRIAKRLSK